MKAILQIGLAAFFGIILTTVASADTKRYGPFEFDTANPDILRLVGPIDLRSALVFRRALDSHPGIETLTLNSVGGSVYTALLIADDVHRAKLTTYIPPSSRCYSACAFIFLAGHTRRIHGNLGVHQISSAGISDEKNLQISLSDIVAAFNKFSINPKILEYMLRTSPDDI